MKKRTYFTLKDLISFGNYMVSDARAKGILVVRDEQKSTCTDIKRVYDADIANWKFKEGK